MKKSAVLLWGILACSSACPPYTFAEQGDEESLVFMQDIDPVVTSVSKRRENITNSLGIVHVIDEAKIENYGLRTAWDILSLMPMLYLRPSLGNEMWTTIYTRGQSWSSVNMLDDCQLVSNEWMWALNVDTLKRAEIVTSPGGTLWGANSSLGVINFVTKDGIDVMGKSVTVEAGNFNTHGASILYGSKFDSGLDLLLSAKYTATNLPTLHYKQHLEAANNALDFLLVTDPVDTAVDTNRIYNVFGKASFKGFTGSMMAYRIQSFTPVSAYSDVISYTGNTGNQSKDTQLGLTATAKYKYDLAPDFSVVTKGFYSQTNDNDFNIYYFRENVNIPYGYRIYIDAPFTTRLNGELQVLKKLWFNDLIAGYVYNKDFSGESTTTYYNRLTGAVSRTRKNVEKSRYISSLYLQDGVDVLGPLLRLEAGVRYERPNDYDSVYNPKFGAMSHFADRWTAKMLYQQAWMAPEMGWFTSAQDTVVPEKAKVTEGELIYKHSKDLMAKVSVSRVITQGKSVSTLQSNGSFAVTKQDGRDILTPILTTEYNFPGGNIYALYSYNDITVLNESTTLQLNSTQRDIFSNMVAKHSATLGITCNALTDLTLGVVGKYVGERRSFDALAEAGYTGPDKYGDFKGYNYSPYTLVNINVAYQIRRDLTWENKVYNLFDTEYENQNSSSLPIPGAPLTYVSSLTYKF